VIPLSRRPPPRVALLRRILRAEDRTQHEFHCRAIRGRQAIVRRMKRFQRARQKTGLVTGGPEQRRSPHHWNLVSLRGVAELWKAEAMTATAQIRGAIRQPRLVLAMPPRARYRTTWSVGSDTAVVLRIIGSRSRAPEAI